MSWIYELKNCSFAYDDRPVLNNLNLKLARGKFYGIVGPNGCGKTTFLDLLIGCRKADNGEIKFAGRPLSSYRRRDLARQVALVPQDFAISFAYTVEDVVLMGRHPYIKRFASPAVEDWHKTEEAMKAIGINHFRNRYVNELSGGEKQRVVVARALAQDTGVLLFDEATSNLDIKFTLEIFNVVRCLVREEGRTVIAVIHNLNLAAAYCDEIFFMKDGEIRQNGPVSEVMNPAVIKDVFGVETRVSLDSFSQSSQVSFRYWS
jgi:iron complex transport system ATP-binding protein